MEGSATAPRKGLQMPHGTKCKSAALKAIAYAKARQEYKK